MLTVDKHLVEDFLAGESIEDFWLFEKLEEGRKLYAPPVLETQKIRTLLERGETLIKSFRPLNENWLTELFPEWEKRLNGMQILLVLGCPAPYDAMVRRFEEKEYLIFDLLRMASYGEERMPRLMRQLLTHECVHALIHQDFVPDSENYQKCLQYKVFDEGFAHFLSLSEAVEAVDFSEWIEKHYVAALEKLEQALSERLEERQKVWLLQADTGSFWEKYAAVSALLFLAQNKGRLATLYQGGPAAFVRALREIAG